MKMTSLGSMLSLLLLGSNAFSQQSRTQARSDYETQSGLVGVQLSGSNGYLLKGQKARTGAVDDFNIHAYSLDLDLQAIRSPVGVIGIGGTVQILQTAPSTGEHAPPSVTSMFGYGGRAFYQAKFSPDQLFIPMAGYALMQNDYRLRLGNNDTGSLVTQGPIFGLWLNLNTLEPSSGRVAYESLGIRRFLMTLEGRSYQGSDGVVKLSGTNYHLGIRAEI